MESYGFDTLAVHAGYEAEPTTKAVAVPIYQTAAYKFDSTEYARSIFELAEEGYIYTRLGNPTVDVFEKRVAALDGGVGAVAAASGHSAMLMTALTLCRQGDEFVSSTAIYGGAVNLFGVTLGNMGITVRWADADDPESFRAAINEKTKFVFVEAVGNPTDAIPDFEAISAICREAGVPFIVDNTFATPAVFRPKEAGADFVVYSATKYICGNGTSMGGVTVDCGTFDFAGNPRFPQFNEPDKSYHDVVFCEKFGKLAFLTRLRAQILRDVGAALSPFNAFLLTLGCETLPVRMQRHCENAIAAAKYLEKHPKVASVDCPALESSRYHALQRKYMPKGIGGTFAFELKGGREAGARFIDALKLIANIANVGDSRSMVIHPASTTHSQLSAEQLRAGGITEGTVRFSVGLEDINDIIADLGQALERV